jgi:hypothetical protein
LLVKTLTDSRRLSRGVSRAGAVAVFDALVVRCEIGDLTGTGPCTNGSLSGSFAGWKAVNTGLPAATRYATVIPAAGGVVKLEVRYGGTLILLK